MPTYEYVCAACANEWEEIQKISEPALEVCPKCGKSTAKRQISGGNFILKGGGWYADSYSSAKPKDASAKDSAGKKDGGGEGGGESKAESKGESKSESTASPAPDTSKKETPGPSKPSSKTAA